MSKSEGAAAQGIILMGMGNPLLDISANVGQDLLDKYNVKLDSAILAEEQHMPIYQQLMENYQPSLIAGGATQNSIRVAQWMMSGNNSAATDETTDNCKTAFMGCIGKDDYGRQLSECARKDGVLVHYQIDPATPTGTCAVLIHGGERSLIANLAAANCFTPAHLQTPLAQEIIQSAQYYYIAGFFLTVSVESLVQVAEHALANDKVFLLNLSAPFIIDFFADQVATALSYADFVFCNESEAAAYAAKHGLSDDGDDENLHKVALAICALPKKNESSRPRTVVFTQGSQATIVACNGSVKEYAVEPLEASKLVDTNGAGDAFVGGFLSQLVENKDMEECIHAGHWAAKQIIQVSGTQLPESCDYGAK